jgi:hypothetical protein
MNMNQTAIFVCFGEKQFIPEQLLDVSDSDVVVLWSADTSEDILYPVHPIEMAMRGHFYILTLYLKGQLC